MKIGSQAEQRVLISAHKPIFY